MKYNSITSERARGVNTKTSYLPVRQAGLYKRVLEGYQEWLGIIGYVESTVKGLPKQLEPFFFHLKEKKVTTLELVPKEVIRSYYQTLKQRRSQVTGELLKGSTLNGHIRNLNLFSNYLEETGQGSLQIDLKLERVEIAEKEVLSLYEIDQLYNACDEGITGLRERAILSLYYGCGLRSQEGINLNVNDILLDKQLVHIRKAKNNRARYVPFMDQQKQDFELYLQHCRSSIAEAEQTSFLINNQGKRISSTAVSKVFKALIIKTDNPELQDKKIGLHTLRHSIATHLLQSGMGIENISQFLGHQRIRSTQTYLHLTYELQGVSTD
ncbi:tyrosine-type recombinase/integrase [Reichenbachiella carrageenanivorans]|uniref:Tyrosine-type recombinase/integrase n=1 Tax=Reichenbachiella carrageenanivorans TaxID=2979869 RepID=A0ABY6CZU9_9BACT|nr:tyrosine-type recombinase/integrase [Reichenbachiella carrageenanivorans]UXX79436.1 tyrosine-type recombinase/integrase [Reichenbachiella carrageenanivorans]UXX79442.1 tyrosine-type recombinase/integrase [Reichenbachiella carrageenanivorans]